MHDRSRIQGFTLLELLIALLVLSIGLLAMAKLQTSAITGSALGGKMTTAIALAQDQMEALINQDFEASGGVFDPDANPWPVAGSQFVINIGPVEDPVVMGTTYSGYRVSYRINANVPIYNAATINVQVDKPGGGNPINVTAVRRR